MNEYSTFQQAQKCSLVQLVHKYVQIWNYNEISNDCLFAGVSLLIATAMGLQLLCHLL